MTEVNSNYFNPAVNSGANGNYQNNPYLQYGNMNQQPQISVRDEYIKEHNKNGLTGRLYNWLKNITGLGLGSKKVEKIVEKSENGEISEEQARETIQKYRSAQANSSQIAGDALSIGSVLFGFLKTKKELVEGGPKSYLRKVHGLIGKEKEKKEMDIAANSIKAVVEKLKLTDAKKIEYFNNPKKGAIALGLGLWFTAGAVKWLFGIVDRIGSKEFVTDKKDFNGATNPYDKAAYSQAHKFDRREKHKANRKNFISGVINGITIPITGLVGGLVGVPAYFILNTLNRYFIGNHTDEEKSLKGYGESLKNNGVLNTGLALGLGIPAFIKTHNMAVFDKGARAAVEQLKHVKFDYTKNMLEGKTTYEEISDILLKSPEIKDIIAKDQSLLGAFYGKAQTEEEIAQLAEELIDKNFFAAKMKQISNDGSALARVLKEDLKPTRSYEEAQEYVDKVLGKGKYIIDKEHYCLGVGTVAETYFARTKEGEEVCIKAIKDKITAEKIKADRDAFKAIIENLEINPSTGKAYTAAEKSALNRSIDDLAEGVLKEIDLANEMRAAEGLKKCTDFADVVTGLEVSSDNKAYVMERARGISLESMMNLNEAYALKDTLQAQENVDINDLGSILSGANGILGHEMAKWRMSEGSPLKPIIDKYGSNNELLLEKLEEYIAKVEAKTPTYSSNIRLEPEDLKNLINEYQQVLVEQFNKVSENGKVIHGDIHPGNIFIDVDVLRRIPKGNKLQEIYTDLTGNVRRKNHGVFTLIDTGNVIELNKEQSISLLNLTSYIEHGNYKKIADYVLQGVKDDALGGHSREEAAKLISDELQKCFLNPDVPLDVMTNDNMLKLTYNIMKKHHIVPNDTQLNLNKAIQSANNSYDALVKGLFEGRLGNGQALQQMFGWGDAGKDGKFLKQIKQNLEKAQEKENLRKMSAIEKSHQRKLDGNLNPSDKDYHIYKLKQSLYNPPEGKPKGHAGSFASPNPSPSSPKKPIKIYGDDVDTSSMPIELTTTNVPEAEITG